MITKFDIGDKVVVKNAFLAGKTWFDVHGEITSICITKAWGTEYMMTLQYPKGAEIRGADVSGLEVPCEHSFKESDIKELNGVHLYFPGKGDLDA